MGGKASNVSTIKDANRATLFRELRKQPLSRAELTRRSGLTKSAVTMITNDLIAEGQLAEIGTMVSARGRKSILLDIVGNYRYAIGVELHRKHIGLCVTNLKAQVVGQVRRDRLDFADGHEALQWVATTAEALLAANGIPWEKLIGIGVSSPGPLDRVSGVILNPPNFPLFAGMPVVQLLQERFQLPVVLENNSVLLTIAEYDHGALKHSRNGMFVIISDGIGSCVLHGGRVYRGIGGHAGELGHTSVDINGPACTCGNHGCLELYATLDALKRTFGFDRYESVVDGAISGDERSLRILDYLAERLACALVGAINLFDVDSVVLFGEYSYRPELLISRLNALIAERSIISRAHPVTVAPSALGGDTPVAASTAALLAEYFNQAL